MAAVFAIAAVPTPLVGAGWFWDIGKDLGLAALGVTLWHAAGAGHDLRHAYQVALLVGLCGLWLYLRPAPRAGSAGITVATGYLVLAGTATLAFAALLQLPHHDRSGQPGIALKQTDSILLFGQILAGVVVPRRRLVSAGARYVGAYRALIAREEREAFPALLRHLQASDWITLVTSCQWGCGRARPLGEQPEYQALHQRIVRGAGGIWPPAMDTRAQCPVCHGG